MDVKTVPVRRRAVSFESLSRFLVSLAMIAAVSIAGCTFGPPRRPLNVVLVSLDTLRPDHLGCYGYHRNTSPSIDRLAAEGVRFEKVVSSTTWTLPSHHSLLTSLPDLLHGVLWDNYRLDEQRVTMAEIFKSAGYSTAGIFTGPYLLPRFGFDQGFDDYIDATLFDRSLKGPDVLTASERGRTTTGALDSVEEWLSVNSQNPFFIFLHLFDIHPDFDPPPPYDTLFDPGYSGSIEGKDVFHNDRIRPDMKSEDLDHLIAMYDGEIRFVDETGISRLIAVLEKHGVLDNTLIVITADHGEEFFEHGSFGHRNNLFDTTLRIPLILWRPGVLPADLSVPALAGIIDIMPTILEIAGLPQSPEGYGRSLLGEITGGAAGKGAYFSELTGGDLHFEALRTDSSKIIVDYRLKQSSLFDLVKDPLEQHPVSDEKDPTLNRERNALARERSLLTKMKSALPGKETELPVLDRETRDRLESLGYIGR